MVTTFCTELTFAVVTKARSRDVETSLRGQQRHHICTAFTCNYTTLFNYYHQHTLLCFTCTTNAQLVSRVCFAITCCVCTCLYSVYYSPPGAVSESQFARRSQNGLLPRGWRYLYVSANTVSRKGPVLASQSDTDFCHLITNVSKTGSRSVTCQLLQWS